MASIEVERFLMRQAASSSGVPAQRGSASMAPRISDSQVRRARVAVAGGSLGEQDCAQLLDMLGLTPDADGIPPVQR